VTKTFRRDFWGKKIIAVDDLSLKLDKGEIVGFVGPNGAGKTTTIKMIMGLIRPNRGAITVFGKPATDPLCRSRIAFVSEQPYFYDYLSAEESLHFCGRLKGMTSAEIEKQVPQALKTVGLELNAQKKSRELSKGMQQRLNFAQALLGDADIFVLDEPMSGLDPLGRSLFRRLFLDIQNRGKTIFFSTHILDDIESLCSRVVVLSKGRPVYDTDIHSLLKQGFLGIDISVAGLASGLRTELEAMGCEVSNASDGSVLIFIPAGKDATAVQQKLSQHSIVYNTIEKRRQSLETILYN
jgi:ABC-2 type transport system ATP-binding protein